MTISRTLTQSRTMYPQTLMLANVMDILMKQPGIDSQAAAFNALLDIVAFELSYEVMVQTPWLKQEILEEVKEELDLDLLREDIWDWFGEAYAFRVKEESYLVDRIHVEEIARRHTFTANSPKPFVVMDHFMGSGRLQLALSVRIKDMDVNCPVLYYGAEPNLLAYRMAVLNFKLHGLDSRCINLNANAYDVRPFSPNWKYANLWNPVQNKRLFTESEVDSMELRATGEYPTVYYA